MLKSLTAGLFALAAGTAIAGAAIAGDGNIVIEDAYARSSNPKVGAAFMTIMNQGSQADRLIAARTDLAPRVELHTHEESADGVMRMRMVEEGIAVPADGMVHLKRGGFHVMIMGLAEKLEEGDELPLTLVFEEAGEIDLKLVIDNKRAPAKGHAGH